MNSKKFILISFLPILILACSKSEESSTKAGFFEKSPEKVFLDLIEKEGKRLKEEAALMFGLKDTKGIKNHYSDISIKECDGGINDEGYGYWTCPFTAVENPIFFNKIEITGYGIVERSAEKQYTLEDIRVQEMKVLKENM